MTTNAVFDETIADLQANLQGLILKNETPRTVAKKIITYLQDRHDLGPNIRLNEFLRTEAGKEGTLAHAQLTLSTQRAIAVFEHEISLLEQAYADVQKLISATKEQRRTTTLTNAEFDKQFLEPLERHATLLSTNLDDATSRRRTAQQRFSQLRTELVEPLMAHVKENFTAYNQIYRKYKLADDSLHKLASAAKQLKTRVAPETEEGIKQVAVAVAKEALFAPEKKETQPPAAASAPARSVVIPPPDDENSKDMDGADSGSDGDKKQNTGEEAATAQTSEDKTAQVVSKATAPSPSSSSSSSTLPPKLSSKIALLPSSPLPSATAVSYPPRSLNFLQTLYANAHYALVALQRTLDTVQTNCSAKGVKIDVEVEDLMPLEQAVERAVLFHNGDFSRLLNLARSRVICNKVADAVAVVNAIEALATSSSSQIEIVQVDNQLDPATVTGADGEGGYRKLTVRVRVEKCHVCEVQVHIRDLLALRTSAWERIQVVARSFNIVNSNLSRVVVPSVALALADAATAPDTHNTPNGSGQPSAGVRTAIASALQRVEVGTCQTLHMNNVTLNTDECKAIHKALRAQCSVVQDISLPRCGLTSTLSRTLCTGGSGAPKSLGEFRFVNLNSNSGLLGECVAMFVSEDLEELNIQDCSMDDLDIEHVSEALIRVKPQLLKKLNLYGNVIGDSGSRALGNALTFTQGMIELILEGCKMGSRGVCSLVPALATMSCLRVLDLRGNDIGPEGVEALVPVLPATALTDLDLRVNSLGPGGAKALAPILPALSHLTTLSLGSNELEEEGVKAIADPLGQMVQLTSLHLRDNKIGLGGARALVPSLVKLQKLSTLALGANGIGTDGIKSLVPALTSLTQLTSLGLESNKLEADGAKALVPVLGAMPNLTLLGLGDNNLGTNGVKALAVPLKKLTNLTSLDFSGNAMKSSGAKAVSSVVCNMPNLATLFMSDNGIGVDGVKLLIPALSPASPNITTLGLGGNDLGADGAKAAAKGLVTMTQLQTLGLDENRFGPAGMKALVPALSQMTQLTTLAVGGNYIGPEGAKALAPVLPNMPRLATLYIEDNQLDAVTKAWIQASASHVNVVSN